jgi:N-acetylglutamate synthase-like GNAT family acetyltransferase
MISIRRAGIEDAKELLLIKINAFKPDEDLYGFGPPGYESLDGIQNAIEKEFYYKILDDQKIIGGMCIFDRGEGLYWIGSIYIDAGRQNKGIGTLAMKFLKEEFPQSRKWQLETPYLSFRNHHFYEKLGFVKVGEEVPEEFKDGFRLFLYEKVC